MSKQSGRPGRRNRVGRQKVRVKSTAGKLKIVIATGPQLENGVVTLARDTELVRAALLYADTVELISPTSLMIGTVMALGELGPAAMTDIIADLDDDTLRAQGADPVQLRAALGVAHLSRVDRRRALGPEGARALRRHDRATRYCQYPWIKIF